MACFVNVILVAAMICCFVTDATAQGAQVQNNDNSEQFALLCRIYNVAKNPPIDHVDLQDPLRIVKEIDALNASLVDPKGLNETEQMGNSSGVQLQPTTTREAAVAHAIVRRITQKTHTILEEIIKVNATRDFEKIKSEFAEVIFGEGMNESHLCQGSLKDVTDRGAAFGPAGLSHKGESAGKNLVVDFFCLCAMRTEKSNKEGIGSVCGVEVGSKKGNHGWDTTCPTTSSTMWASVKKECGKHLNHHAKSTEEAYEVIEDFLRHLTSGGVYRWGTSSKVEGSDRKAGMLGTGAGTESGDTKNNFLCDGSRGYTGSRVNNNQPPGGICVYYGKENWSENIAWLKKIKKALNEVDTVNNQTATIQRDIEKLQTLLHRAEEIYQTSKVITEVQNPVQPPNLHTAAKRLTAYSASRRHHHHAHFILLFVLLS